MTEHKEGDLLQGIYKKETRAVRNILRFWKQLFLDENGILCKEIICDELDVEGPSIIQRIVPSKRDYTFSGGCIPRSVLTSAMIESIHRLSRGFIGIICQKTF